jgi:Ca2+-binding RTX toxin-like protein
VVLNGLPITFSATNGTMSPPSAPLASFMATSTYTNTSCPDGGPALAMATLDNGIDAADITINCSDRAPPQCAGLTATIVGTSGNDTITGTNGNDVIHGLGGDDIIKGGKGDDIICGGDGNDALNGGNDADRLFGENGNDTLNGNNGADALDGGANTDTCNGNKGTDTAAGCESVTNVP